MDFYVPTNVNLCRFYEIWYLASEWRMYEHNTLKGTETITSRSKKEVEDDNAEFMQFQRDNGVPEEEIKPYIKFEERKELIWTVKFLTPNADCLWAGETPYVHQEHPYTVRMSPLIDGEVYGYVYPLIDQQRAINRSITMMDWIRRNAGKNLLIFPESAMPEGYTHEEIIQESRKSNGVIFAKIRPGGMLPTWLQSASSTLGLQEVIAYQLQFIKDESGIQGAMMGQAPTSGTPAIRYAEEARNSSVNILDWSSIIKAWRKARNFKQLMLIQQFFDKQQYIAVTGAKYSDVARLWEPEKIKDLKFTTEILVSDDSPTYNYMANNSILELAKLYPQEFNLEMLLENTSLPYSEQLLKSIRTRRTMAANGQTPPPIDTQGVQGQPVDQKAMQLLTQSQI
jgi:hypothetical protein